MERRYHGVPNAPSNWDSYERFQQLVLTLDKTSSPGIPYLKAAPTIGKWLEWNGESVSPVKLQLLWYDTQRVMAGQFDHHFRVFVKDEPHSAAKVRDKRWRLIIASALPVQMAWRLAFQHQNEYLNAHPYSTPSAHGLVFCYGGWRRFKHHAQTNGFKISRDISAWDINAPGWITRLTCRLRQRWGGPPKWLALVASLYRDAFEDSKLQFSNGWILQQTFPGYMKSGLYNTIADNSLHMGKLHIAACVHANEPIQPWLATGDDVLQQSITPRYISEVARMGITIKEWHPELIFMGTSFVDKPVPMYFAKHLAKYATASANRAEIVESYARYYAHSPLFKFWKQLALSGNTMVKSPHYYQFWFDSPLARAISAGIPWF